MTAFEQIKYHIENKKSFVLEAGAGSGKTYTLIETLNYLIETRGEGIQYNHQKIICITYTNVAKNEIIERLEHNPLVMVSTIHEFLWDCIKSFQIQLKLELCKLNEIKYASELAKGKTDIKFIPNLSERVSNFEKVNYDDTSFRDFEKGVLHHDDVITLSKMLFENYSLLTTIITQKYPYLLVDEYQDTAEETTSALIDFLLKRNQEKIVLGFYGDSHQKIYDSGVGELTSYYTPIPPNSKVLELVKKEENYRSAIQVVKLLNNFRSNITQNPIRTEQGSVQFIYCNNYPQRELKGSAGRKKDENITDYEKRIAPLKNDNYDKIIAHLQGEKWDFGINSDDKILVIANSRVAKRACFGRLYEIYNAKYGRSKRTKEQLLDRNHPLIKYFVGYIDKKTSQEREVGIEHLVNFWSEKNYNEVIRFLRIQSDFFYQNINNHAQKKVISGILSELNDLRLTGSILDVYNFVVKKKIIRIPVSLGSFIIRINLDLTTLVDQREIDRIISDKKLFDEFMKLPYSELISFFKHTQNNTVFSTKHGTKGEEYRNVLTVIDDTEWKQEYNFENFFNGSEENSERKLKTRNLFYVECSRAKENLVVLALSEMNPCALNNVRKWFGDENVISINEIE